MYLIHVVLQEKYGRKMLFTAAWCLKNTKTENEFFETKALILHYETIPTNLVGKKILKVSPPRA